MMSKKGKEVDEVKSGRTAQSGCGWLKTVERVNYKRWLYLIEMIMQAATDDGDQMMATDDGDDGDDGDLHLHESVHDWVLDSWQRSGGPFVNNPCWDSSLWPLPVMMMIMIMFCNHDDDYDDDDCDDDD